MYDEDMLSVYEDNDDEDSDGIDAIAKAFGDKHSSA